MLFRGRGEGTGIEVMIDSDDRLDVARAIYEREIIKHPGRLVMLCDRAHALARSDRPETMPPTSGWSLNNAQVSACIWLPKVHRRRIVGVHYSTAGACHGYHEQSGAHYVHEEAVF
jgi:hypothetical protein